MVCYMIKNSKGKLGLNSIVLQKVRKQRIRFWDERTFWHEIIYKSLIPTFGSPTKLSHAKMFSRPKILFLVSLLFVALLNSIPTYL